MVPLWMTWLALASTLLTGALAHKSNAEPLVRLNVKTPGSADSIVDGIDAGVAAFFEKLLGRTAWVLLKLEIMGNNTWRFQTP